MFIKINQQLERCARVIRQRVRPHIHPVISHLKVESFDIPGEPMPVPKFFEHLQQGEIPFKPFTIGRPWGTTWGTTWFKVSGRVPKGYPNGKPLELLLDLGWYNHSVGGHIEGMVYRPDGTVIKAVHPRNFWVRLMDADGTAHSSVTPDGSFTVYLEAACNPLLLGVPPFVKTNLGERATGRPDEQYVFRAADLTEYDERFENYWLDLDVVSSVMKEIDPDSPRYWQMGKALQRSLNAFDEQDLGTVEKGRNELRGVLSKPANASSMDISAIGHAHIDSAWIWPVRETKRKVARTVSNVLALMDEDPDFKYAMSSAQQYAWLEESRPDLWRRMMTRIRQGRFIPVGGMWVESDGMLPAGESFVRQITFGQRYFRTHLGVRAHGIWLPDSFGYAAAWPQIARRAGYDWFLTQKISWNDTTKFPHHSFMWEGLDGTRIFTHFPPADTYAASMTAKELHYTEKNFKDKDLSSRALMLFGYGDGGGGPTREMMGRVRRFHNLEGMPRVTIDTPDDFFDKAYRQMAASSRIESGSQAPGLADELYGSEMPVWKGELYLELHRKTLTSQQEMKRLTRQEESLLRTTEYLCAAASLLVPDFRYPKEALDHIWKKLLLDQFHDILPGSGIAWVHRQARQQYARDISELGGLIASVCAKLEDTTGCRTISNAHVAQYGAQAWQAQPARDGTDGHRGKKSVFRLYRHTDGSYRLRGGAVEADVTPQGTISSLVDVANGRQLVSAGMQLGAYELFKDEPTEYDAWNLDRDAFLRPVPVEDGSLASLRLEDGGRTARLVQKVAFAHSRITTTTIFHADRSVVDVFAHVDWHEQERFLKVCLPLAVASRRAIYDTQYGIVRRPVRKNTASEEAGYESCTHRFVRIADEGYGVAVVNASTYGCDVTEINAEPASNRGEGTLVRLSLLSSPVFPDPHTDQGDHDFHWRIVPDATAQRTLQQATDLNAFAVDKLPVLPALVRADDRSGTVSDSIVVDWVKMADDGSGDVIARLYEPFGERAEGVLHLSDAFGTNSQVKEVGLLEDNEIPHDLPVCLHSRGWQKAQGAHLSFQPFELATLRIHR